MPESRRSNRVFIGTAIGAGATVALSAGAQAADIPVTSLGDNGSGTLREAIGTANTAAGADRIVFQSGLSGRIELEGDLPQLLGPVAIEGPGTGVITIDGQDHYAMFSTTSETTVSGLTLANAFTTGIGGAISSNGGNVTLEGVRLTSSIADKGGAIAIGGANLKLKDSEVTGNSAMTGGGIYGWGAGATITGSKVNDNRAEGTGGYQDFGGGAFFSGGMSGASPVEVNVTNSEFSGNSADRAAGLLVTGPGTTIDSSLISENTAAYGPGGIQMGDLSTSPHDSISNSTITGNVAGSAAGGIVAMGDNFNLESSTVTGNRVTAPSEPFFNGAGLITGGGASEVSNSIVSGNTPADLSTLPAQDATDYSPAFPAGRINGSFSLIGNRANADFTESIPGSNVTSTDPQLGPLRDNGGPTKTMLPADASPVIDQGSSSLLPTDGRGLARPIDFAWIPNSLAIGANGADIGAVEVQSLPEPPSCKTDPSLCPKPPPPPAPSNAFSFGWIKLNKKKGVASLQVRVPGPGKILVLGSRTVARSSKAAPRKMTIAVKIKAKGRAAKSLRKKGRAKVKAKVKFTPTGGTARTKSKTVKLVRKKARKKKNRR